MTKAKQTVSRPSDDGFYLPAEWCRHARTWMAWPESSHGLTADDEPFKNALADVANSVRKYEPITIIVNQSDAGDVRTRVSENVDIMVIPHESARIRDTGPTFLVDGKGGSAAVDWLFDGWAGQVDAWRNDMAVSHRLLGETEIRRFRAPLTLEGTAFCCDGAGTVIALATSALDPDRNNNISKLDGYDILSRWLGVSRVIWIDQSIGKEAEATELRRACVYVGPAHVFVGEQKNKPWSDDLDAIAVRLNRTEDAHGQRIRVDRLPVVDVDGCICTYTTFYILNTAVLVPGYGVTEDEVAVKKIGDALPGRAVRIVPALDLVKGRASLSSVTQYLPARLLERNKATLLPKSAWQRPVPDYVGLLEAYIARVEAEE